MAINYTQMRTSDIKGWNREDCKKWLQYMHEANEGLILFTARHMLSIVPTGDFSGFIVDFNDGRPPRVYSNSATVANILDAVAVDHHGRLEREQRDLNLAVYGRMDGRDNIVDKAERKVADLIDYIFD